MSRKKDTNELIRMALDQGWEVTSSRRKGHIKYTSPEGKVVWGSATPGGARAKLNTLAALRRAGLAVPGKRN